MQPGTWTDEGNDALLASAQTDVNGNEAYIYIDGSNCNHWILGLAAPGDDSVPMAPIDAGAGGSFTFQLPVIPMEGTNTGRVVITEPEALQNSYTPMDAYYFIEPYSEYWHNAGLYNFVFQGGHCDDLEDPDNPNAACWDLEQCFGARLHDIEPFEEDLVLVDDGGVEVGDPTLACGPLENAAEVAGKIAILRRGECSFYDKVINSQDAGAIGMIMVNNGLCSDEPNADPDECVVGMATSVPTTPGLGLFTNIPFVQMGRRQGEELIAAVENGETVRAAMGPIADPYAPISEPIGSFASDDVDPDNTNDFNVHWVPLGEMGPAEFFSFFPAAAYASGSEGAFFQTDIEINNKGDEDASVTLLWLPRGQDNSEPMMSDPVTIGAGESIQYPNALNAIFGLTPNSVGAVAMVADSMYVIGMSRTYNIQETEVTLTFGQALPAVPYDQLIMTGETQRITFMSENDAFRANLGCVNGTDMTLVVDIDLYDAAGTALESVPMSLPPWSNKQLNQIFDDYSPTNGYVDVSTATADGAFYCYGSVLDNATSDPTTVLPQVPSDETIFIPAAAVASGSQGAFFQTDFDINNAGGFTATYSLLWLPRGQDNSTPTTSDPFALAAGSSVRIENVLGEIFGLQPNSLGALAVTSDSPDLVAMTRTYNLLGEGNELGFPAGSTFGQALPGVHSDKMITTGEKGRIIFMNEDDNFRANLGCVNGVNAEVIVTIDMFDSDGMALETKAMVLAPWSNKQLNQIFSDYAPVNGYVDVYTATEGGVFYCYGSVLDNVTSDPTTVLPQ